MQTRTISNSKARTIRRAKDSIEKTPAPTSKDEKKMNDQVSQFKPAARKKAEKLLKSKKFSSVKKLSAIMLDE